MLSYKDLITMADIQIQKLNIGKKAKNLVWMAKNEFHTHISPFFLLTGDECDQIIKMRAIPLETTKNVEILASKMGADFFFIRSSAQFEDTLGNPSAGLFLTKGKVPYEEISNAIYDVIVSARKPKVLKILGFYPSISVIVQKMISPNCSGVLFTKDPVSNDDQLIIIEAGYGMGETVVSGKFNTDHYELEKFNPPRIKKSVIPNKLRHISPDFNSEQKVPENLRKKAVLSEEQAISLSSYAIKIEEKYGNPIDLEWAIDNENKIWFLQIRETQ